MSQITLRHGSGVASSEEATHLSKDAANEVRREADRAVKRSVEATLAAHRSDKDGVGERCL